MSVSRKKKSRWDDTRQDDPDVDASASARALAQALANSLNRNTTAIPQASLVSEREDQTKHLALPETLDSRAAAQLKQQKEMQMLEQKIRDAAKAQMMGGDSVNGQDHIIELHKERLLAYQELAAKEEDIKDKIEEAEASGGYIEGGTWEHRKRAREMLQTADAALDLTLLAKGAKAHHIGQYLPKSELDAFLKKAHAVKTGTPLEIESDFSDKKLDASNLGFQMLQKAGWKEGQAVGSRGSGILEPVNMHKATESVGLGVKDTHEVDEDDDEFSQYRKRMMLAYRFRPNPMNNPRRAYY